MTAAPAAATRSRTFRGGVHPHEHKESTHALPIERMPFVSEYVLPLSQHIGAPSKAIVAVGEEVPGRREDGERFQPRFQSLLIELAAAVPETAQALSAIHNDELHRVQGRLADRFRRHCRSLQVEEAKVRHGYEPPWHNGSLVITS